MEARLGLEREVDMALAIVSIWAWCQQAAANKIFVASCGSPLTPPPLSFLRPGWQITRIPTSCLVTHYGHLTFRWVESLVGLLSKIIFKLPARIEEHLWPFHQISSRIVFKFLSLLIRPLQTQLGETEHGHLSDSIHSPMLSVPPYPGTGKKM